MHNFLSSVFWLLITLGVLVTFHEFGHYWMARRCGVRVLRFSIGFGKALWKRIGQDGCQYQIAAIPLGGYVKMLDAREGEVPTELRTQEFTNQPVSKRIAIVLAGPVFNVLFTIAAFWCVFMLGRPTYAPVVTATRHSLAEQAGIKPHDWLLRVGHTPVKSWSDAIQQIANALPKRKPLPLEVRDDKGHIRHLILPLEQLPTGRSIGQYFNQLGLKPAPLPPIAATVKAGQPAAIAGIRAGDRLISINGHHVTHFEDIGPLIATAAVTSPKLVIWVERHGKSLPFQIVARQESIDGQASRWMIGVGAKLPPVQFTRYGPLQALGTALKTTWQQAGGMIRMIGDLFSQRDARNQLSGVIGIAHMAHVSASMGLVWFLKFLALISLSLGIMNLLPIPLLDGGHLFYYVIELVTGHPVSERVMLLGQYVGMLMLFALMGLTFYNDIHRIIHPA